MDGVDLVDRFPMGIELRISALLQLIEVSLVAPLPALITPTQRTGRALHSTESRDWLQTTSLPNGASDLMGFRGRGRQRPFAGLKPAMKMGRGAAQQEKKFRRLRRLARQARRLQADTLEDRIAAIDEDEFAAKRCMGPGLKDSVPERPYHSNLCTSEFH